MVIKLHSYLHILQQIREKHESTLPSIHQPPRGPLSLVLDPELKLPTDSSLALTTVHNADDLKDLDLPLDFPRYDDKGTTNEVNDQSRGTFLDDIDDLLDDANLFFLKKPFLSADDENPNSETARKLKLDSSVSTDHNTPEALMEQPTNVLKTQSFSR